MGNETAAVKRPTGDRRGSATGRQVVGEYTGQRAGDAAQAVRRAGLRPGLERSFGCDASLLGLVVSQEPEAGSALARNGMVTLHVAAPGSGLDDTASPSPEPTPGRASAPEGLERAGSDREPRETAGAARRRRKPGLSGRAPDGFDIAPAPLPRAQPGRERDAAGDAASHSDEPVEVEPADEVDRAELSENTFEENGFDGLTPDEFVVHVDDVFAGRAGRWRAARRAPRLREAGRDLRERLAAHPWLVGSAAFAVGLWVLLGTLGAVTGQHPAPRQAASSRLPTRAPVAHTDRAPGTPTARTARPARGRPKVAPRAVARRRALPKRRARAAARPARAARPRVAREAPAAASLPARSNVPAPAGQRSGGLFSP